MINKISFKKICAIILVFLIHCDTHASSTQKVEIDTDNAGKTIYKYAGEGNRWTYADLRDQEIARNFKIVIDVLSKDDIAQATINYEPALQKAKILVPFMAGVAFPFALMWSRSTLSFPTEIARTAFVAFAAYESADIRSFWTHMIADHTDVNNKDYPVVFRFIPLFFQDHHLRKGEIQTASYWYVSRLFYLIDLPVFLVTASMAVAGYEPIAATLALSSVVFVQNQIIHAYAHKKKFGNKFLHRFMSLLQSSGLIISYEFHAAHHEDPRHSMKYSAISGHTELLCEHFFPRLIPYIESRLQGLLETTARTTRKIANAFLHESFSFMRNIWG